MKISALNTSLYTNKYNKSYPVKNTAINQSVMTDTVSFKSSDYISEGLKNVDEIIDTQLKPFMKDSKMLYLKTAEIGYSAQEAMKNYSEQESGFMAFKMDLLENSNNPVFSKTEKYLTRAKKYEDNVHEFDNLSRLSKLDNYSKPEIKESLKELKSLVYSPNKDLESISKYSDFFDDNNSNLQSILENVTLEITDNNLLQKMNDTKQRHMGALYYIMMNPYNESLKLIDERKSIEEDSKKKPRDLLSILKRLDHLQQEADKIAESVKLYYENKDKVSLFTYVSRHYDSLTPTKFDLDKAYTIMKKECRQIVKDNHNSLEKDFANEYEEKLAGADLESVDMLLKKQSEKAYEIQSMINDIKQEIINKNNEEFERLNGFNFDD